MKLKGPPLLIFQSTLSTTHISGQRLPAGTTASGGSQDKKSDAYHVSLIWLPPSSTRRLLLPHWLPCLEALTVQTAAVASAHQLSFVAWQLNVRYARQQACVCLLASDVPRLGQTELVTGDCPAVVLPTCQIRESSLSVGVLCTSG